MSAEAAELWGRASQAREALSRRLLGHPEVSLVDVAAGPAPEGRERLPVLRVHVRHAAGEVEIRERLGIPAQVDGIATVVTVGDYHLE